MPYMLFTSYQIMQPMISLPLQMAERLLRAQPDSVANHVKARQSLIERSWTGRNRIKLRFTLCLKKKHPRRF